MSVRVLLVALFLCFPMAGAAADNGLIVKPSAYSVIETIDRLEAALDEKDITVFARIDHAEGAQRVEAKLPPTELILFGNPRLGTPLMQSAPEIGLDLPLKALAWQDEAGEVWLAYNDPGWLVARHGITDKDEIVQTMTGALDQMTDRATKAE